MNHAGAIKMLSVFLLTTCGFSLLAGSSSVPIDRLDEIGRIEKSMEVLKAIVDLPEEGLPEALLRKAHAVAIFPGVIKAAYGIGGQFGKGIVLVRSGKNRWSYPCFIRLVGGSVGWQIGIQKMDIVLVFKSVQSITDIAEGKITLGADVSVTAGPVGRRAEASTDLDFEAEIYSYAKSKGLFAGISLKGAVLQVDNTANREFYGRPAIRAEDILTEKRINAPAEAEEMRRLLERLIDRAGRLIR